MGKIIPFQNEQQSLEILTNTLLSKIKEGKFSHESSYSKGISKHLETYGIDDINAFLLSITPLVEAMDWKYKVVAQPNTAKGRRKPTMLA